MIQKLRERVRSAGCCIRLVCFVVAAPVYLFLAEFVMQILANISLLPSTTAPP